METIFQMIQTLSIRDMKHLYNLLGDDARLQGEAKAFHKRIMGDVK